MTRPMPSQTLPETPPPAALAGAELTVEVTAPRADLANLWRDLEGRSDGSYFQSWGWIGTWLGLLPASVDPRVLVVREGAEVVGLGIVVAASKRRHRFVRAAGLYLNETGDPTYDQMTVEYNGLLADRRVATAAVDRALDWLVAEDPAWDELNLGGLEAETARLWAAAAARTGLGVWVRDRKPCDFVDLGAVRRAGGDYLASLSRNTRYQIRRSIRLYTGGDAVLVHAAGDRQEARRFFAELKAMHQDYWTSRGHPGSFAKPFFERFHETLIDRRFDTGEIQLLRISAGESVIGYLYNFDFGGRIYAYQSGFRYSTDPKLKPGLVSHHGAIEYNLSRGAEIYDFMAGEGQHKGSLGTAATEMSWLVLQRPRLKYRIEHALRSAKRRLAGEPAAGAK